MKKAFVIGSFLLFAAALLLVPQGTQQRLRALGRLFVQPAQELSAAGLRIARETLGGLPENFTVAERDQLLSELAAARLRLEQSGDQVRRLENDNRFLMHLLKLQRENTDSTMVVAEVIRRDPLQGFYHELLLNRGHNDGLKPGHAVISVQGLVGIIGEVSARTAQVRLISSPDFVLPCRVLAREATGILRGPEPEQPPRLLVPPQRFTLDSIVTPGLATISGGDRVSTCGLGSDNLQDNLPVGVVGKAETTRSGNDVYQVIPYADLDRLRFLMVILPNKKRP